MPNTNTPEHTASDFLTPSGNVVRLPYYVPRCALPPDGYEDQMHRPATVPPPRGDLSPAQAAYMDAKINAALAELESCRGERDAARRERDRLHSTICAKETEIGHLLGRLEGMSAHGAMTSTRVARRVNDALAALGIVGVPPLEEEPRSALTLGHDAYTAADLKELAAFVSGIEWTVEEAQAGRLRPRSIRLLAVEISNARQALANEGRQG